jgi:hypothetical protein
MRPTRRLTFGFAAAACLALAGCQTTQTENGLTATSVSDPNAPVAAGVVRFAIKNPDGEKWQLVSVTNVRRVFRCRPLACPSPASAIVTAERSPTRSPDKTALEKLAAAKPNPELLAQQSSSDSPARVVNLEKLAGRVTSLKGFPTVVTDYRITQADGKIRYASVHSVFAGFLLVTVTSQSFDKSYAAKVAQLFAEEVTVDEGPRAESAHNAAAY